MRVKAWQATILRAEYPGMMTLDALVRRVKLSPRTIQTFWQREREAGRLLQPLAGSPRCVPALPPEIDADDDDAADVNLSDTTPIASAWGTRCAPDGVIGDPLLAALRRAHGDDGRPDLIPRVHDLADASRDERNWPTPRNIRHLIRTRDRIRAATQ